jgi:hypothetical protein
MFVAVGGAVPAARDGGILPGSSSRRWSPTTGAPFFGSKRTISEISFCIPPTSSQGIHTL